MKNSAICFLSTVNFRKGERKYVQFSIVSTIDQKVVVNQASYELTNGDKVIESGSCEIIDNCILRALLEINEVGNYDLEVTYMIAPEIRKARCKVNVN